MNKKRLLVGASIILSVVCFSISGFAQDSGKKSFLWEVRSDSTVAYIFGSIHAAKEDIYPLPRKIGQAFQKSNTLAVEANIEAVDPNAYQAMLLEKGFYPSGESLEKNVSKKTYALIEAKLQALSAAQFIQQMKPWLLALILTDLQLQLFGYSPEYGIDKYFLNKAQGVKQIAELESWRYQINLLSDFSQRDQETFLVYTLEYLDVLDKEVEKIIAAWSSGDVKTMEYILITEPLSSNKSLESIYEKLFFERNRNMASKIEGFLKTNKVYFVVVGAGHLVGKKGVIGLLEAGGYSVKQL